MSYVLAVAAAVLVGGCGTSAPRARDACTDVRAVLTHYTTDAPEFKAFTAEVEKQYKGTGKPDQYNAARTAYFTAYGKALRATADEAKTPELKAAITAAADNISKGSGNADALKTLGDLCPGQSS